MLKHIVFYLGRYKWYIAVEKKVVSKILALIYTNCVMNLVSCIIRKFRICHTSCSTVRVVKLNSSE